METEAHKQVFQWLADNLSLDAFTCPLCDRIEDCSCYTEERASVTSLRSNRRSSSTGSSEYDFDGCYFSRGSLKSLWCDTTENADEDELIKGCHIDDTVKWNVTGADLLLKAEKSLFPIHRSVVSRYSDVFKSKLEKHDCHVIELNVRARNLRTVLEYLYDFGVDLDQSNVSEILVISGFLDLYLLEEQCKLFLDKQLSAKSKRNKKTWWIKQMLKKI